MKIKLVAPLICRNGTVLLKPKNVHIINEQGIEELMEEFDLKKILTTKIGTDYVGPVQTDNQIPTRNSNNTRPVQMDNQIPTRNSNNIRQAFLETAQFLLTLRNAVFLLVWVPWVPEIFSFEK